MLGPLNEEVLYKLLHLVIDLICYIWRFITYLATFDTNLQLKFSFVYLAFLTTFWATFGNWAKNGFKLV